MFFAWIHTAGMTPIQGQSTEYTGAMEKRTAYEFRAFGYEIRVSQNIEGKWVGSYREGSEGEFYVVTPPAELNEAKMAICRQVQIWAGQSSTSAIDPCKESLSLWKPV
jgi:hypothetical protein